MNVLTRIALRLLLASAAGSLWFQMPVMAELQLPSIFGSNMVLQQQQVNRVWGWGAEPGQVTVVIGDQTHVANVDEKGDWHVKLDPLSAGGPLRMVVSDSKSKREFENVMVGEVWICSGQSNMQWSVKSSNDADLEVITADYPNIRLITVPQVGTDEPQRNFQGGWTVCSRESVPDFSAVGYFFGRQLHQALAVPIGLINNAWGGSACEAWIRRESLSADPRFAGLNSHWQKLEEELKVADNPNALGVLTGNQRPANIFNGVLLPTIGYGIKGVIWYQGETNAGRAYQYRELFPFMIESWRKEWGQGDFPFYWVQLADFQAEKTEPGDSAWAELREAQTLTMKLPNTGEAVILNLGEASDIHPKNKQDVAKRLARWALARDYGFDDLVHHSPTYESMEIRDAHIVLSFANVGGAMDTFDVTSPIGFTIAGDDKSFKVAQAELVGTSGAIAQIKVWSDQVANPVAVRYGWADNPVCNVQSVEGLPLTPFRTDDWDGVTKGADHP